MAWDMAKNIDLFDSPNDLAIVLAGETIPGQFPALFQTFSRWKTQFNTDTVLAEASEFRNAANRGNSRLNIPQSVEGAQIAKERAEAAKQSVKEARAIEKQRAAKAKEVEQARRAQEKREAEERAKAIKEEERARPSASRRLRRPSEHGVCRKRQREKVQLHESFQPKPPTHPTHPIETLMIDPRLSQLGPT
ncbi:uncharacterized protein MELLADRAFT_51655 [Melampsora larici-populina 98AG31]|uniref:Uncharacterized protein n=1 Tax=Melampsora larici-populina (strain 98AG31 / pathotype 3-4-7) TaxID=747676 RepID=F4R8Y5_MELLP|nr:uncharacterized protein MELLADRAFT_51655 [Melampsora larici-populina 98AG31]EGG10891.1 hypothetical protein MELLADRAFT_51655 [Melampsora larici-populina 98AG31]